MEYYASIYYIVAFTMALAPVLVALAPVAVEAGYEAGKYVYEKGKEKGWW